MTYIFYPTASAKGQSLSGQNIWLRPKVKIVPTVQHCLTVLFSIPFSKLPLVLYYFSSLSSLNMHWHHRSCACCLKGRTASWIPLPLEQADISHCGNLTRFFFSAFQTTMTFFAIMFHKLFIDSNIFLQLSIFCGFSVKLVSNLFHKGTIHILRQQMFGLFWTLTLS